MGTVMQKRIVAACLLSRYLQFQCALVSNRSHSRMSLLLSLPSIPVCPGVQQISQSNVSSSRYLQFQCALVSNRSRSRIEGNRSRSRMSLLLGEEETFDCEICWT